MNDRVQAALEARKKKKEKSYSDDKVAAALKSREERLSSSKESIVEDITSRYSTVLKDYNITAESYSPSYGENSFADTVNKYRPQTLDTSKLRKDIEAYRKYIGDDKTVEEMLSTLDSVSGGYRSITENAGYYSQFESKDDQTKYEANWLKPNTEDTAEQIAARKSIYEGNKARIAELDAEMDAVSGDKKKYSSLENEKKKLEDENRQYERIQGKVDSYAYVYDEADFGKTSVNRDFTYPTRDELQQNDTRMDSTSWYYGADGKTYNAFGEVVAENDIYGIDESGSYYLKSKSNIDRLGLYLSTDEDVRSESAGKEGSWEDIIAAGAHGNWEELTEEEISAYYYLLNRDGYEAADKFLDDMTQELNRRATEKQNAHLAEVFEDANPLMKAALNLSSVAIKPIGNIAAGIEDAAAMLTGQDLNPYSTAHGAGNFSSQVRGLQAEEFDELTGGASLPFLGYSAGDVYQAGMSFADNLTALATGSTVYAAQMGAGAFSDTASDMYLQGASMGEIGSLATIAGVAEGLFEKYSIDKLIEIGDAKTVGQILKNALMQGGIEATEEMATEVTNIVADGIIRGGTSKWNKLLEESGGNVLLALAEETKQVLNAGLSGAIAGALGGGGSSVASYIGYNADVAQHGQDIIDNRGYEDLKALAMNVSQEASGIKSLDKAVKKADAKKSAKNVGRLSEQVEAVRGKQNTADIQAALEEKGMSKSQARKTAQRIAEVAEKKASGADITQAEYDSVTKDKATYEVYSSLISDPDSSVNSRKTKYANARQGVTVGEDGSVASSESRTSRIMDRVVQEVALENIASQSRYKANTGVVEEMSEDDVATAPMTAEDAMAYKGKTTYTDPESGETKVVKVQGISSIENGEMKLKLEGGETVDASDVRFASEGEALVYSTVLDMGVNAGVAEALVNNFKASGVTKAGKYALGIKDAYAYGRMNIPLSQLSKNSFAYSLSDAQMKYVYDLGASEAKAETKAKQKAIDSKMAQAKGGVKSKSGKVIVEDASIAVDESGNIDETKLNKMQKANLVGIKALAELSPINFHIFQSDKVDGKFVANINGTPTSANGVYMVGTNDIWIDLNAGDMGEGTMLWTAAHEISHYIKARSPAKWKSMADFLMKEYSKKQGVSVSDMLNKQKTKIMQLEDAGTKSETQIIDEAYEELVSDALSDMLVDGNVVSFLAEVKQKDKGLWQTIKDAVADLLKRWGEVLDVYEGRDADTAEAQALRGMDKAYKKLQRMYAEAFAEANAVEEAGAYLRENGIDVVTDGNQEAASLNSVRNLLDNNDQQKVAKALADRFDVTEKEALDWLTAETSLASLILNPKYSKYLDYEADASEEAIKKNSDYPQGTVDFSNICKKRRAFTEVMGRILRNFPNHVFMATDLAKIRTIMEQEGMEVACAICYVEDRRQLDSIVAQNFLDSLELYRNGSKTRPDGKAFNAQQIKAMKLIEGDSYTPSIYELVTLEGRNELKAKNPAMEEAWVTFNNARGMQSVRLLTNEAEYKRQILKYNKKTVQSKNDLGGLRIYSFSDMEMFHLIDIIQVITDSASVGLMIQGYTKVNEYAKAVKDTGEKLNRSLIPKGDLGYHIEDGKVVLDFDTVEGIDINHPDFFDSTDNPDVGNIVIGINETQIRAAMVSEFIDYIIPFHTGQSKEVLGEKGIAEWNNYEDSQSERDIATGKKSSHQINIYTEVIQAAEKEGKPIRNKVDFVNKFLAVCKENGLKPRFSEFLNIGENGEYVYTEGYHKFLVDFKTFDQRTGEYLPQRPVKPIFDNAYITGLLEGYVESQKQKDADVAKAMPKVLERITNEVVKPAAKYSERYQSAEENLDILSMIERVESGNFKANEKVSLGIVSDSIAKQIQALTGINVDGFKVAIEARQIEHILKDHGKQGLADQSMAEPSNIAKMGYALNDPDEIRKAGKTQAYTHMVNGRNRTVDTVLYEKNIGTKSYYVVQAIPDTKAKTLYIVTAFIGKEGYKKEASQLINAKSLDATAKTGSANASGTSIPQSSDSVKRKLSERNQAPTFYSHMGKVVDGIKNEKVGAGGVVPYLKGKGVKNEEIKWSGIETFLEDKKSVTKAELQAFVAGSMLQIEEETLTYEEMPYSQEHLDQIAKYEAERDTIAENLKSEWKRIVGTDIPIVNFGAGLESAVVNNLLEANATIKGNTEAGYKYKAAKAALQRCIEYSDDYFGYDNERQAYREAIRNPEEFMSSFEMTSFEKGVFRDFIKAKEAYKKVEGISLQDQKALKAIAESADRFNSRIAQVKAKHRAEEAKHIAKWGQYKLDGGTNYRELLFILPDSTYSNTMMGVHWDDKRGVLVHARIQDFDVDGKKMLFVEEIQSDWHNEGHKDGYDTDMPTMRQRIADLKNQWNSLYSQMLKADDTTVHEINAKMDAIDEERTRLENKMRFGDFTPDAPFRSNYHEFVLKRLIRMAAENGYDLIGWTPADVQSERWSDEYAEGYRIEYDQDIPKFLNKYGKKWGAVVGKMDINGETVWSMPITDSMKDSVLYEGQALYSERNTDSNRSLLANALETTVQDDIEARRLAEYKEKISLIDSEQQQLAKINAEIRELSFSKGKRDNERLRSLRFDAVQIANRINTYDRQLLNLESTKVLKRVLEREKGLARKRQKQKDAEALKEYRGKVTETRDKREAVKKLQKLLLDTSKWISYPTKDDVKCPDILKVPYADFLNSIDLSSKRSLKGGEATQNDMKIASAMNSLATAIEQIKTAQNPTADTKDISTDALNSGYLDLPVNFIVNLRKMAENITRMMIPGQFVVNTMSAQDIKQISKLIRTLNHSIKEMSTLYSNLRFSHVEEVGDHTISFLDDIGKAKSTNAIADYVTWDNALPFYAFRRFGEGGESVFEELMDAQDKLAFLADEIFKFKDKNWTDKEAKAWGEDTHTIKLPSGSEVTLTTADAMGIYCLSRREQAVPHLLGGGIRVVGQKKGVTQESDSRATLTEADLGAIISSLSKRQMAVADAIQEFMSTVCAEWGNEISMKRFLTKEFREKYYYPIESSDENLPVKDQAMQQADLYRLLNISATKPLTEGANNAIVIRNIFEVFTNHASDMAKLNAYGMALLDYMKWVNYREKNTNDEGQIITRGVRQSMNSTYGDKAFSYVINLIKDVNGRYNDGGDHAWLMKMTRTAKTAMVGNSLRVAVLQVTAYPRAGMVLSQKSLALGLKKKPQIKKAQKYCGVALWKSFGFYETNIARSIEDQIKGTTDIRQKLIEWSLKGAELGDAMTWGLLWNACEYEVANTNKTLQVGSEEFNQAVGKKLREVVYATQVVDSTLTRSQIMRNKSGLTQGAAAFMSEPTVSANILMDAGFRFRMEQRRTGSAKAAWEKTGKRIGKAITIYSVGQLTAAVIESLVDAYRDDDDEEFSAKFLEALKENFIADILPFNKIPIISDVVEAALSLLDIGYFSSDNISTTWLSQTVTALTAWKEVLGEEETSKTLYNAIYNTTRALSSMTGVAVSGAMREVVTLWNNTAGAYDSTLKVKTYENTTSENGKLLYEAIVGGDEKQAMRLEGQFEDADAVNKALVKAIRENDEDVIKTVSEYINGDVSAFKDTVDRLVDQGFDEEVAADAIRSVVSMVNSAAQYEANGDTENYDEKVADLLDLGYDEAQLMDDIAILEKSPSGSDKAESIYKKDDYFTAIDEGDTAMAEVIKDDLIDAMVENGKTEEEAEESLASSLYNHYKDEYIEGNVSDSEADRLIREKNPDFTDADVYWELKKWKAHAEHKDDPDYTYSKYGELHEAILNGDQRSINAFIQECRTHTNRTSNKEVASDIASAITSHFKPIYIEASDSERAVLKKKLLTAYTSLGYASGKRSRLIDKWLEDN